VLRLKVSIDAFDSSGFSSEFVKCIALSETVAQQIDGIKPVEKEVILSGIAKLRKDLIDATPYLPSFDRRQSELVR
jgi:hypothetical protein